MIRAIIHSEYGNPAEVCGLVEQEPAAPGPGMVCVDVAVSPIDPADINLCQGTYAVRPPLPSSPGIEGVGHISECGEGVNNLSIGDRVLCPGHIGHWSSRITLSADRVYPIPTDMDIRQAAMILSSMATPWLMIRDFTELSPGDWIIQNAANSAVGRSATQIARCLGLNTLNLVRRDNIKQDLLDAGADIVMTEVEFDPKTVKELTHGANVRLALNGVGGHSASLLSKSLSTSGTMVTYGGMSMEPVTAGTGQLIFKDLRFRGFWITQWYKSADKADITKLLTDLIPHVQTSDIKIPVEAEYSLEDYLTALEHAQRPHRSGKIQFLISE